MMVRTVSFRNKAVALAAHLHLPDDFSEDEKYPALVGIHPAGGVKEQTIGTYAARLAAQGFVTVVYDSSYQGESGGEPRLLEDPTTRVEDARCAADFLTTLPFVDADRMGVFGICAGGGYAISVAQTERRFKAVATVSAAPMGEGSRAFLGHSTPVAEQIATLEMVAKQRTAEAREKSRSTLRSSRKHLKRSTRTRRTCYAKGTTTTGLREASTPIRRAVSC
jgi:fermentation-respiration switch protein FrsA (DUF1100 family)